MKISAAPSPSTSKRAGADQIESLESKTALQRAVPVDDADEMVEGTEDDLGHAVAVDVADGGRIEDRGPLGERWLRRIACLKGASAGAIRREDVEPAALAGDLERPDTDGDLGPAVAVEIADRGARRHRSGGDRPAPPRQRPTVGPVGEEAPAEPADHDVVAPVAVDVRDRGRGPLEPRPRLVGDPTLRGRRSCRVERRRSGRDDSGRHRDDREHSKHPRPQCPHPAILAGRRGRGRGAREAVK